MSFSLRDDATWLQKTSKIHFKLAGLTNEDLSSEFCHTTHNLCIGVLSNKPPTLNFSLYHVLLVSYQILVSTRLKFCGHISWPSYTNLKLKYWCCPDFDHFFYYFCQSWIQNFNRCWNYSLLYWLCIFKWNFIFGLLLLNYSLNYYLNNYLMFFSIMMLHFP